VRAPWSRATARVRPLTEADRVEAEAILTARPVTSILAAVHLEAIGRGYDGAQMLGVEEGDHLTAVCWAGANLVPVGAVEAMPTLASWVRRRGRRSSSVVGSAELVHALWSELSDSWPTPREVRANQPALVITGPPAVPGDARVRLADSGDFDVMFPASVAMFTEEVGYDPTRSGGGYAQYVRGLLATRRSFVVTEDRGGNRRVVFKADIGALWGGIAQVQGVWVHPERRGRGLAPAAMAAVVDQIQAGVAPTVSLYVNDYNAAARAVYAKVGFVQAETYATVLF